ncbi:nose resistant to fluoxetine protein 6-like, partial [Stegodyphus dumicola]|uniref:nose resistant to fluoxetine protein 6-like n=1 Tax=Stegodyphus dumicola TaxID=202533 RepID=UPI0015AAA518
VISYLGGFLHNLHVTTIKVGLCTPSLCTTEDINKLVQIIPEKLSIPWKFDVSRCEIREPVNFTTSQFISLYVIGILAALIITGTIVSYVWSSEEMERSNSVKSTLFNAVKAFSFTSNAKKLSDYTCPEENLSFVYGIIFIVFYWVVISNTFMYVNYDVASNFIEALRIVKHLFYELVLNRIIPLQSIFFVSGLLTTYRYLKSPEKNLNVFKFIFKRYWRYTPAYGLILALVILTPTWGSGPSWYSHLNPMYMKCRDNWWYNLLYINNFLDTGRACLDHTWVIAVDAQLHVIAIFILIPLKLRPKIGLLITFVLALASLTSVALTNVYYDLPPNEMSAFLHPRDRMFYAEHTYYRVYTHLSIYCTGVFVGYFMAKYPNIKISKKMSTFLWLMTTIALITALTCVHEWRNGAVPSPLLGAIYTTFSKIAQASFLAWVAVACMTGHSDGVRDVLSWRPFHFLSRLAFIGYIMHVPIINMLMGFRKAHIFISELEIFHVVLSHAAATYVVTYILYICFEAPWLSLADVVRKRCKARTFTSTSQTMTEKPVKYLDKEKNVTSSSIKIWTSALEKGQL